MGEEWFKRINRDATTNSQFNKFVFEHFSERRLLNTSTPNFLFGLADSPRVSIVANLKFRRLAFLRHRNIWVLKYHHDTNYNTFLCRLIGVRYIKLTKAQIQKIKTDLYDNDFNIAKFYEPTNLFNDNFYLKKKKIVFNQIYHLNFKFEIDSRNPSREKKETIESTNAIYKKTHKIPSPDKINET